MVPLLGFAPDLDPITPGVLTDCTHLIPNERAMQAAPSAVDGVTGLSALGAACRGAAVVVRLNGSRRTFAATQTDIFELTGTSWTDVCTTALTGSSENRVMFAQFGDTTLATNDTEAILSATSGNFTAIAGAPKARIVIAVPKFVVAMNTNDGTYGDSPDRWWCSEFENASGWAPSVNTQCATERIIESGGEITAGLPFGSGFVAYKSRAMYLASYSGPPSVFVLQRVPGEQGCVGPEAVCDIGGPHVFVGEDNIWLFDGSRPVPIGNEIRQWFYNDLSPTYRYRTIVTYDRNNGRVWVFYPSTISTGNPDSAVVYHIGRQKWGRSNRSVEAALNFVTPGLTWDTLNTVASTWDTLPNIPWDSQAWQAGGRALGVFNTSHQLKILTGSGENSGMTTGDLGDDDAVTFLNGVRLRFLTEPTTATATGQTKMGAGQAATAASTSTMIDSKFPLTQAGRWHRFSFLFTGNTEVTGIRINGKQAGSQ